MHTHDPNEELFKRGIDYVESVLRLAVKVLRLDKRSPRDSHYKEFEMGFFDAAFKF
jgi:ribosomal protein L31E